MSTPIQRSEAANFTLVALFDSPASAATAADTLRDIIESIGAWWQSQENPDATFSTLRIYQELTPPEEVLKMQYQLRAFEATLDWIRSPDDARVVAEMENQVILDQMNTEGIRTTWCGATPFDAILRHLGATVMVTGGIMGNAPEADEI